MDFTTMNDKHYPVSVRLTASEKEHLERIATTKMLNKKDGSVSLGLALKDLIKTSILTQNNPKQEDYTDQLKHLIRINEQANVMIPQLLFNAIFTSKYITSVLDNEKYKQLYQDTMEQLVEKCGQIQQQDYRDIYVSYDQKNMKTIPIEKEKNKWKSR